MQMWAGKKAKQNKNNSKSHACRRHDIIHEMKATSFHRMLFIVGFENHEKFGEGPPKASSLVECLGSTIKKEGDGVSSPPNLVMAPSTEKTHLGEVGGGGAARKKKWRTWKLTTCSERYDATVTSEGWGFKVRIRFFNFEPYVHGDKC